MKRIILFAIALSICWSCKDDDAVFNGSIPPGSITFDAIYGGAIMRYDLPKDASIYSIRVRYTDATGKEQLKTGSYLADSLVIDGFHEARTGVQAQISLCDHNDVESKSFTLNFDTRDAATISFFDTAEVSPYWDGFRITYEGANVSTGYCHVFYLGENPLTHKPDSILVRSFPITPGRDTLYVNMKQLKASSTTVILRTDDFNGNRVMMKPWENMPIYRLVKLDPSEYELIVPKGLEVEKPEYKLGKKYLFDGDIKGQSGFASGPYEYCTFVAGPNAYEKPFIIDLKNEKVISSIRFYSMYKIKSSWPTFDLWGNPSPAEHPFLCTLWHAQYHTKVPCKMTVYASNDKDNDNSWKKIGEYNQDINEPTANRWAAGNYSSVTPKSVDEINGYDPMMLEFPFPIGETYRYVKFVVHATYYMPFNGGHRNAGQYIALHEIEMYTSED